MEQIGLYKPLTAFSTKNAGTSEWCIAEKDGKEYFIKKFLSPVYPSKELELPEKKYQSRIRKYHATIESIKNLYDVLRKNDTSGALVVPVEIIGYQYHICAIADYVNGNVSPNEVCKLSEWQRIVLMRTLALALMHVHDADLVHSDMRPANVLITQNEEDGHCALKLIDFDGSFMASNPPEDIKGDPAFFAPEVYAKASMPEIRFNKKIDIFALGIIFHFFWTGKLPEKENKYTIGQSVLNGYPVELDASIPDSLREIIQRSLEGNPDKRITAEQIYKALEQLLSSYPVKIINLQNGKRKKPKKPDPIIEEPKTVMIPIAYCDRNGKILYSQTIEIAYGKHAIVCAEEIPGYRFISGRDKIEISVDNRGTASETAVYFTYEKDKKESGTGNKFLKFLKVLLVLGISYCLVMFGLIRYFDINEKYRQAKECMEMLPIYSVLFPEDYERVVQEVDHYLNELREGNRKSGTQ